MDAVEDKHTAVVNSRTEIVLKRSSVDDVELVNCLTLLKSG